MDRRLANALTLSALAACSTPAWALLPYTPPPCPANGNSWSCGYRESVTTGPSVKACPTDRWIGYRFGNACPAPGVSTRGSWSVSSLFPNDPAHPAMLSRFCVYQWTPRIKEAAPDVGVLPNVRDTRLERDCHVVGPQYVPNNAAASIVQSAYAEQITRPLFPVAAPPAVPQVRVAVIDSAPDDLSGMPTGASAGHAMSVASLIRETSCRHNAAGSIHGCAAFITNHQALTLGKVDGDGTYGYPSEVGRAMLRAIDAFKAQAIQTRLILNVSLGWDGRYGAHHGPQIRLTALAPWMVAQWAADQDVLVIAAAGNAGGGPTASGPLFPGGWETEPYALYPILGSYDPLVYAIGGVDGADVPLSIGRDGGMPRLVAPAVWLAAPRRNRTTHAIIGNAEVLTGTSMAAAAASGVLAMAWSHLPNISNNALVSALTLHATPLPGTVVDFELYDSPSPELRRIDACKFVDALGIDVLPCAEHPAGEDLRPALGAYFDAQYPGLLGSVTPGWGVADGPLDPGMDAMAAPWVSPQPGGMSCPTCRRRPDGRGIAGRWELDPKCNPIGAALEIPNCPPGLCGDDTYVKLTLGPMNQAFHMEIPGLEFVELSGARLLMIAQVGDDIVHTVSDLAVD